VGDSGIGPWQSHELQAFLGEFANRGCPVIPTLLDTAPAKSQVAPFPSYYRKPSPHRAIRFEDLALPVDAGSLKGRAIDGGMSLDKAAALKAV
jgi:hypothetical protein